jgi:hypothetical protein
LAKQQWPLEEEVRLMLGIQVSVVQKVVLGCNRRVVELSSLVLQLQLQLEHEGNHCQEQEEVPGYYKRVAAG